MAEIRRVPVVGGGIDCWIMILKLRSGTSVFELVFQVFYCGSPRGIRIASASGSFVSFFVVFYGASICALSSAGQQCKPNT